jgi:hypothetical protein
MLDSARPRGLDGRGQGTDRQLWSAGTATKTRLGSRPPPELPPDLRKRWNSYWGPEPVKVDAGSVPAAKENQR